MGLELIDKELHSICKNDIVKREDIVQLCNRLGVDGKDEQVNDYNTEYYCYYYYY